jgi:hypothetical protein
MSKSSLRLKRHRISQAAAACQACDASQASQVDGLLVLPKNGVYRQDGYERIDIERNAPSRRAGKVAALVDRQYGAVRVAADCRQLMNSAVLPEDGLLLKLLA